MTATPSASSIRILMSIEPSPNCSHGLAGIVSVALPEPVCVGR
jgi:hypothetical protein